MKLSEMKEIRANRENADVFLHHQDKRRINRLLDGVTVNNTVSTFYDICDLTLDAYSKKLIKNKAASEIFDILARENTLLKTESHRFESGNIYEWRESEKAYTFLKKGSFREFKNLNHYV